MNLRKDHYQKNPLYISTSVALVDRPSWQLASFTFLLVFLFCAGEIRHLGRGDCWGACSFDQGSRMGICSRVVIMDLGVSGGWCALEVWNMKLSWQVGGRVCKNALSGIAISVILRENHNFEYYPFALYTWLSYMKILLIISLFDIFLSSLLWGVGGFGRKNWLNKTWTILSNGYLGSRNDEERSEMRYVMRIAEFSESSNLWTQMALLGIPWEHTLFSVFFTPLDSASENECISVASMLDRVSLNSSSFFQLSVVRNELHEGGS